MRLIVRVADYGMTDSITDGTIKSIRDGIVTDVGLMTNDHDHAKRAVEEVLRYPHVSIGQDLNLVSGRPASDPKDIPSLVDEDGIFISSVERKKRDLYDIPYDEIYRECKAQVERFIKLVGRKPAYITGHSLSTPEVLKAMDAMRKEYDVDEDIFANEDIVTAVRWYYKHQTIDPDDRKPSYTLDDQAATDVEEHFLNELGFDIKGTRFGLLPTHCGYCDGELLDMSSFSVIRGREVEALCSPKVKKWIEDNDIELINYDEYVAQRGER